MLEKLLKYPAVLARHRNAPFFEERNRYLSYRAEEGCAHETLLRIARELLQVVQVLNIPSASGVTPEQIRATGDRWARLQCRRRRAHTLRWPRELFVQIATHWLRFLGRLDEPVVEPPSFAGLIEDFTTWIESERGLSLVTIRNYGWHVKKFLHWYEDHNRSVSTVQISDVDTFLASCGDNGWSRVSVASNAKALKAFFHYAEDRGWCSPAIAHAIQGPRLFYQETLPSGPTWEDVNRLIEYLATDQPQDIRDRAIILLFALCGLRSSEVGKLRLEDIDWENNQISVSRSKQRRIQIYPLIPIIGNAIIRYLRIVRLPNSRREIFLMTDILVNSPRCQVQPVTFRTLLLLLYGTGLRISEALSLTLADVDLPASLLTVRNTKFFKTRWVPPIGPQLNAVLVTYAKTRRLLPRPARNDSAFFATLRGNGLTRSTTERLFRMLCERAGIRRMDGGRFQPRLHDIRHTFALNRLISWYREGKDVQRLLPFLSTYMGHVDVAATRHYLAMTPELLNEASLRFQRYATEGGKS